MPHEDRKVNPRWNQRQQAATADHRNVSRVPYRDDEDRMLRERLVAGDTILQIAARLRRTWYSVQGRIKYLKQTGKLS